MGRSPCCEKVGLKKGPWTPEEDLKLMSYINQHGDGSWRALASKAGLQRCGKSCRLRWINYLRPDIKRGKFSLQEEQTIVQLHALLGNRWSIIAYHLPQRTDNEIKNFWNTHIKKKLTKMGIDPVTHKPISGTFKGLNHLAQWETARLEAEARLARQSTKLHHLTTTSPPSPNPQQNHPHNFMREQSSITIGGPIFQSPNKNLCVGHNHDHGHENDVSLSVEADPGFGFGFGFGFEGYIDCGVDIMECNYHVGNDSESDNGIMRGRCSFGHGDEQGNDIGRGQYGAGFEDNNISTTYWDDIMSIVHDSAQPLLLDPASSFGSPFFLSC